MKKRQAVIQKKMAERKETSESKERVKNILAANLDRKNT